MRSKKKLLTVLFAVALTVLLSVVAFADNDTETIDGIEYSLDRKTMTCSVLGGENVEELTVPVAVPYRFQSYTVVRIESGAFKGCDKIGIVFLPTTVREIGAEAFADCSNLARINLTDVENVGNNAFEKCTSLLTVELNSAEIIGKNAFNNCVFLDRAVIGENISVVGDYAFGGCASLKNVTFLNKKIPPRAQ